MLDSAQHFNGRGNTFDLREPIGPEVSCINLLEGTGFDIFLEACKVEATCNSHEAGVSGVRVGGGM